MEQTSVSGVNLSALVPKLEFINFEGRKDRQNLAARKEVREAAMRSFRRRERLQRVEAYEKQKARRVPGMSCTGKELGMSVSTCYQCSSVVVVNDGEDESILGKWEKDSVNIPSRLPLRRTLDPCGTQSVGMSYSEHYLLNHFVSVIALRPFRFQTDKEQSPMGVNWARKVLTDPVLMQATVLNASVHLDGLLKRQASSITLRHRGETIRMVNESLSFREQIACDSVIAAVTLMAWSGNCNIAETVMHMDALVYMVDLRGGLEHLGFEGTLQMLIIRLDLIIAAMTMSRPRFSDLVGAPLLKEVLAVNTSRLKPTLLDHVPSLAGPIPIIFSKIQYLITLQESFGRERTAPDDVLLFGKLRASLSHDLLCCQKDIAASDSHENNGYLYESCRIAALLFTEYILAGLRPNQVILRTFGKSLRKILGDALQFRGLQRRWDADYFLSSILLWVYFVGGLVIMEEIPWYAMRICHYMTLLKLESWGEVKTCLLKLLWAEQMEDQAWAVLWKAVQRSVAGDILER